MFASFLNGWFTASTAFNTGSTARSTRDTARNTALIAKRAAWTEEMKQAYQDEQAREQARKAAEWRNDWRSGLRRTPEVTYAATRHLTAESADDAAYYRASLRRRSGPHG
jgi:hypothetical protein